MILELLLLVGTLSIDSGNIYCFRTGLPISMAKSEETVHIYLMFFVVFIVFLMKIVMFVLINFTFSQWLGTLQNKNVFSDPDSVSFVDNITPQCRLILKYFYIQH